VAPDTLLVDVAPKVAVVIGSGMAIFSPDCCTVARAKSNSETSCQVIRRRRGSVSVHHDAAHCRTVAKRAFSELTHRRRPR